MIRFALPTVPAPDPVGAFLANGPYAPQGYAKPEGGGALAGLMLGIKDLFDVAGLRTGAGSPVWLARSQPANRHAPAAAALLDAGARFVGKTLTDELAWSLNGENAHFGSPVNVAAPGRIPGGSSAGSAAAVAAGMVEIALGSDTGGSVRLPASYCGIWGLRPTHGRIDLSGAVALAPSFDTAGWFAGSAALMASVGGVLLPNDSVDAPVERLLLASDMFERVDDALRDALVKKAQIAAARLGLHVETIELAPAAGFGTLAHWRNVFRIVQSAEAWQVHRAFVEEANPAFGPGIAERFAMAKALSEEEIADAMGQRLAIRAHLGAMISPGTLLVVPGAAGIAPLRGLQGSILDDIRARAIEVLCPAVLGGLPQLAFPALRPAEGPLGLGLIGWAGGDESLLALGARLEGL